jgi:saccharopine dehydrogenase-like NADP-dependent oxidoreductase
MAKQVLVLGAGMIGAAIARDMAADAGLAVRLADLDADALAQAARHGPMETIQADLSDTGRIADLARSADLVLGALPSAIGFAAMRAVAEAGRDLVDVSFMAEDARSLDALARERGATVVFDCGVAPGLTHMLSGRAAAELGPCEDLAIYVGGLPAERHWPFEYKAGFAPRDVIEEYTRPVRLVDHGRVVVREALSEPELLDFPGVGTLEAFNTDGLRSLVETLSVPQMKEKTLRYPGHIALMRVFREMGLFSKEPLALAGAAVRPIDFTAELLFPRWAFGPGEADITVMRVQAIGCSGGKRVRLVWELLDRYDPEQGQRSMSRVTAFPACAVARLLLAGTLKRPGVHPPEVLGADPALLDPVLSDLAARGVGLRTTREDLPPSSGQP